MIVIIVGPTCTNKTKTSIALAKRINAEIVNGDAFQCYKELNIGVAKPSKEELNAVTHHLFSFKNADTSFSIASYQKELRDCISEIQSRNKNVVIVGGSGLYIRSAIYDYDFVEMDDFDSNKYEKLSNEELHCMLEKVDPIEANKIHPNNRKRVIRALEIYDKTKITKSEQIAKQEHKPIYKNLVIASPIVNRDELYKNINSRVDTMIKNGLEEEVKELYYKYGNIQSLQAIGYKEFIHYFLNEKSLEETIELIKKNSRNYAKRQITFVKHQFENVYYYKDDASLIAFISSRESKNA